MKDYRKNDIESAAAYIDTLQAHLDLIRENAAGKCDLDILIDGLVSILADLGYEPEDFQEADNAV